MQTNNTPNFNNQYYQPPVNLPLQFLKKIRFTGTLLGMCVLIYLAVSYFVPTAASAVVMGFNVIVNDTVSMQLSTTAQYWIQLITYILSYLIPFTLYAIIISMPAKVAMPMRAPRPLLAVSGLFIGLGASVAGSWATQGVYAVMSLFGVYPVSPDFSSPSEPVAAVLNIIMLTVAAPIIEELVFRGAIMQSLRRFGDVFAVVVSALIFALFHGNLVQAPNAFIMGLVLGFFVIKSGSLWVGILIHFANNLISTVYTELSTSLHVALQGLVYSGMQVIFCVLGVIGIAMLVFKTDKFFSLNYNQKNTPKVSESNKYIYFFTSPVMIVVVAIFAIYMLINTSLF